MQKVIAIAASLLVNLSLVAAFERSADEALPLPSGQVIVTDLSIESAPSLVQASIVSLDANRPVAL
jgi:hypothetical protein